MSTTTPSAMHFISFTSACMTCISLTANSVSDPDAWLASELADARDDDDDDDASSPEPEPEDRSSDA
eukprot:31561-Pelagococcus_subviridis.AAC.9